MLMGSVSAFSTITAASGNRGIGDSVSRSSRLSTSPLPSRRSFITSSLSLACLLAAGCGGNAKQSHTQKTPPAPVKPSVEKKPALSVPYSVAEKPQTPLESDITIDEFFQLRQDRSIKSIVLSFHAPWCENCEYLTTRDYQEGIKAVHREHPEIRIVTMDIDAQPESQLKIFQKIAIFEPADGTDPADGNYKISLPKTLYIRNRDGRYFKWVGDKPFGSDEVVWKVVLEPEAFDDPDLPSLPLKLQK